MRRVAVESPFRGADSVQEANHIAYARACMADCLKRGEAPIASHLLLTQPGILDDSIPKERARGIAAGLAWSVVADVRAFYVDLGISEGMALAMAHYERRGLGYEVRSLEVLPWERS